MAKKFLLILISSIFLSACAGLKGEWNNFRAYYNTYYNAKEHYRDGVEVIREQPVVINPEEPVLPHRVPALAGKEAFERSIDKSALVLRRHSTSKWTDDALLLMGKSYYYLLELSAALDRFEQVLTMDPEPSLMQQAMVWKGRTLLEMKDYTGGIAYVQSILQQESVEEGQASDGELQLLMGEYTAMLGNWEESVNYLSTAVNAIEDRKLLGRSFFLYGQVLERLRRLGEALFAYKQVPAGFPGFEYTYWAELKQAEVNRKQGNLDAALSIYRRLQSNNKYADSRDRLSYEIARTLEMKEQPTQAEQSYRELLYGEQQNPSRVLQAAIYYRLGQVYSNKYRNFTAAAAYFDTSSSLQQLPEEGTPDRQAEDLADAYGRYANLRTSVQRIDSLLWLGSLSQEKLDSVIQDIRLKRRQEMQANQQISRQNQSLVNRPNSKFDRDADTTGSGVYGFLNHRNRSLVSRAKAEFTAVWGNRPPVDNWRRREAVRQTAARGDNGAFEQQTSANKSTIEDSATVDINIEAIPKTRRERERLAKDRSELLYQLGSVLFLELNRPDSAKTYFHKVVNNEANTGLHPKAMYALYEVSRSQNEADSSHYWSRQLSSRFPNTQYVQLTGAGASQPPAESGRSAKLPDQYYSIMESSDTMRAGRLRRLALQNRSSGLAAAIHFESIKEYINRAKNDKNVQVLADSLPNSQEDSSQTDIPTRFHSARWDSVRLVMSEHDSLFSDSSYGDDIQLLQDELVKTDASPEEMPGCRESNINLAIKPSMQAFLKTVEVPEGMQDKSFSGAIAYDFVINREGKMLSYRPASAETLPEIEQVLEDAFDRSLEFELPNTDAGAPKIRCRLAFPVEKIGKN